MKQFFLIDRPNFVGTAPARAVPVFCPAMAGLAANQADLAIVLPHCDNNGEILNAGAVAGDAYAGVLACDPFNMNERFWAQLGELGYKGVVNWPSSVAFEGVTRNAMGSVPATPEVEYKNLAVAQDAGLEVLAFVRSLQQGRAAIKAGLRNLVLYTGFANQTADTRESLLVPALQELIRSLRRISDAVHIYAYANVPEDVLPDLKALDVEGLLHFGVPDDA